MGFDECFEDLGDFAFERDLVVRNDLGAQTLESSESGDANCTGGVSSQKMRRPDTLDVAHIYVATVAKQQLHDLLFEIRDCSGGVERRGVLGVDGVEAGAALNEEASHWKRREQIAHLTVLEEVLSLERVGLGHGQVEQGVAVSRTRVQHVNKPMDFPAEGQVLEV